MPQQMQQCAALKTDTNGAQALDNSIVVVAESPKSTAATTITKKAPLVRKKIPKLPTTNLIDELVHFPQRCQGAVTIALFGFDQSASSALLSWSKPLHKKFDKHPVIKICQFAMVGPVNFMTKWVVDSGMKTNVEKKFHPSVFVYYGELTEWKEFLKATEIKDCYVLLLDDKGHVHAEFRGSAEADSLNCLETIANELAQSLSK